MQPTAVARETGLWKRGVFWLLLLAPLFFSTYNFSNWYSGQRDDVAALVFAWEQQIPLLAWTIVPYWSIDLLYGLAFLLPTSRAELDRLGLRLLSAQIICITCFLLWPLRFTFDRPELDGLFGAMFDVLMGFDKPFNQAPSLHITLLAVLWACYGKHIQGVWRYLLHGWFLLIGISVLTTWQHHFIDVPTGMLAGFICLWLWPSEGRSPLSTWRIARTPRRWKMALFYALFAALLGTVAIQLSGVALWLLWPTLSLLLVALNYALLDARGFQKRSDGQLSLASTWLLAPYLAAAWLNSRAWTRKHPQADEVVEGIWLGRIPGNDEASAFTGIVDLCAELPCRADVKAYRSIPALDLIPLSLGQCKQAANAIESVHNQGTVLVCCALGYSRSAMAVAAWLLLSGRSKSVDSVLQQLRKARPNIMLSSVHLHTLQTLLDELQPTIQTQVIHGQ